MTVDRPRRKSFQTRHRRLGRTRMVNHVLFVAENTRVSASSRTCVSDVGNQGIL